MSNELDQLEKERRRGWIVKFLNIAHPKAITIASLVHLLDKRGMAFSQHKMASALDFLCSMELIRVFPSDSDKALNVVEQAKLLQKFDDADNWEMAEEICVRISKHGIQFHEGNIQATGVKRIN